ncbi:MAG: amino acid adenylation domain-containing protein [Caldilineaceae bacterium]|nr:amino acid adenylation domain-containing protein [Caldilineaceae bacterium]
MLNNHRNVLREVRVTTNSLGLTPQDRVALTRPIHLYGTMKMVMSPLMNGASLHITNLSDLGALGLANWLRSNAISVFAGPVTLMRAFANDLPVDLRLPSVRWVLVGAEALYGADIDLLKTRFGDDVRFHHSFGTSESGSVHHISFESTANFVDGVVPAGYRHEDLDTVIFDDQGRRLAADQVGQIGVISDFLALGYWRKPELTSQRFVHDPESGKRLYLTGDLGLLRADGCLIHLGREDHQVKIGGNRVEIAEVEAALLGHPAIVECCVVLDKSNPHRDQLLAHCVLSPDRKLTATEIYTFLAERLPSHMMPARFNRLAELPKTAAGKTDRFGRSPSLTWGTGVWPATTPIQRQSTHSNC